MTSGVVLLPLDWAKQKKKKSRENVCEHKTNIVSIRFRFRLFGLFIADEEYVSSYLSALCLFLGSTHTLCIFSAFPYFLPSCLLLIRSLFRLRSSFFFIASDSSLLSTVRRAQSDILITSAFVCIVSGWVEPNRLFKSFQMKKKGREGRESTKCVPYRGNKWRSSLVYTH